MGVSHPNSALQRSTLRDFGIPARLVTPLGTLLALDELVVAAAVLVPIFVWWGGLGALLLLVLFVAGPP